MSSNGAAASTGAKSVAWPGVLAVAAAASAVRLLFAGRYGFHRDELYYVTGGWRLDPGYVDHPLLLPWLAGATERLFGPSLHALRLWPIAAGAASIVLAALIAAELGGAARAQRLAALATALCPFFFIAHQVFQTNFADQLVWTAALVVLLRGVRRAPADAPLPARTWLGFGGLAAVGFLAKYTVGALGVALVIALALRRRREFRNPFLYLGGALALLGLLPGAAWQLAHGLPFLEFAAAKEDWMPWASLAVQVLMVGPATVPLVVAGALLLLRRRDTGLVGWVALLAMGLFLAVLAKPYYANAVWVPLFGAGGVALGRSRRRWPEALLLGNLAILPLLFPLLPVERYARLPDPIGELAETVGWPELVDQVDEALAELPAGEDVDLVVLTANYGEAAALELLGRRLEADAPLRRAVVISGHNSYAFWIEESLQGRSLDRLVLVGYPVEWVGRWYEEAIELATIGNPWGIDNEERGAAVVLGRLPRLSREELIRAWTHYN